MEKIAEKVNSKDDFSFRFREFLDKVGFPEKSRFVLGAEVTGTTPTTFRNWCTKNSPPRRVQDLHDATESICQHMNTKLDMDALTAWLLTGTDRFSPFHAKAIIRPIVFKYIIDELSDRNIDESSVNKECLEASTNAIIDIVSQEVSLNHFDHLSTATFLKENRKVQMLINMMVTYIK